MTEVWVTPPGGSQAPYEVRDFDYKDSLEGNQASTCNFSVTYRTPVTPGSHVIIVENGEVKFRGWCLDWEFDPAARIRTLSATDEVNLLYYCPCPLVTFQLQTHKLIHPFRSDPPNQTADSNTPQYTIGLTWWSFSGLNDYNWQSWSTAQKAYKLAGWGYESRIQPTLDLYVGGRLYTHRTTTAAVLANPYSWTQDLNYLYVAPLPYKYVPVAVDKAFENYVRLGSISDKWSTLLQSPLKVDPKRRVLDVQAKFSEYYSLYYMKRLTMDYTFIEPLDTAGRGYL